MRALSQGMCQGSHSGSNVGRLRVGRLPFFLLPPTTVLQLFPWPFL